MGASRSYIPGGRLFILEWTVTPSRRWSTTRLRTPEPVGPLTSYLNREVGSGPSIESSSRMSPFRSWRAEMAPAFFGPPRTNLIGGRCALALLLATSEALAVLGRCRAISAPSRLRSGK